MLKAIIIDDEPHAREKMSLLLQKYCNDVEVVAVARNADEGATMIREHKPDVVFLDIEMPGMTGFDMLLQFETVTFEIIFTTAHDHYAIRAIKFSALDYLLKPIDADQLVAAVKKAGDKTAEKNSAAQYRILKDNLQQRTAMDQLAVPGQAGMTIIKLADILYCEASSNYTHIILNDKRRIISSRTLKEYDEMLTDSGFIRIHHSHLVNRAHVQQYVKGEGGQVIMKNGTALSVSRRKKEEVMEKLRK